MIHRDDIEWYGDEESRLEKILAPHEFGHYLQNVRDLVVPAKWWFLSPGDLAFGRMKQYTLWLFNIAMV